MRNGIYSFRFDARGHLSRGSLALKDDLVDGGDTRFTIQGQFSQSANSVVASVEVTSVDVTSRASMRYGAREFSLRLVGSGSDTQFDVIGVGPRGLIVVMAGERMAPLAASAA